MKRIGSSVIFLILLLPGFVVRGTGQQEQAQAERILKIGTPNEVKSANIFGDYYLGIFAHISNPPLMKMNQEGELVGQTAEGYQVSEDHREWTFLIRDDLVWSDGIKLTPEDVCFSIEYTGQHNPNARWIRDTLEEASIAGERSVVLRFNKPYTRLNLEFATYNIFPKHIWEGIENPMQYENYGENVGCGPFFIREIDLAAGVIRFTRNPYWQGNKPELDGFEIHIFKNMDVLSLALERGDVDTFYKYASSYPYASVKRLEESGRFDFSRKPNMGLVFLGFNLKQPPFSDLALRQAVAYATDYEEILKLDALGYGTAPNRGFVPPSMGGYRDTPLLVCDPGRSAEILAAAGYHDTDGDGLIDYPDGRELSISILVRSDWVRVAELLKDYLGKIGIDSTIRSLDMNSWVAEKDKYNYDLTITRTTPWGMLMHASWGTGYLDSRRTGQGVLHVLEDPAFLALSDEILSTVETSRLDKLASSVQDYYAEKLPVIALYWNEILTPFNSAFQGWKPDPLYGIYNLETLLSVEKRQ